MHSDGDNLSEHSVPIKPPVTCAESSIPTVQLPTPSRELLNLQTSISPRGIPDSNINPGQRCTRLARQLYLTEPHTIASTTTDSTLVEDFHKSEIYHSLFQLVPFRPGQTEEPRSWPCRKDFEYAYKHFNDLEVQRWCTDIIPWIQAAAVHNLDTYYAPILDIKGNSYPDLSFSPEVLLNLPGNSKQSLETALPTQVPTPSTTATVTAVPEAPQSTQSASPDSFVLVDSAGTSTAQSTHTSPGDGGSPPPGGHETPPTPAVNTPTTPETMTSLREQSVFFPSEKFNGRNKALTKQHWQNFADFCDQHHIDVHYDDAKSHANHDDAENALKFFKMTLTDIAREWCDRTTFEKAYEIGKKFLEKFCKHGENPRDWLRAWNELKFEPHTDNIDTFIEDFDSIGKLNKFSDEVLVTTFKLKMPREIEMFISKETDKKTVFEEARRYLGIHKSDVGSVATKFSSLAISEAITPEANSNPPRSRSPSPMPRPILRRERSQSRQRYNGSFRGWNKYPGDRMRHQSNPGNWSHRNRNARPRGRGFNRGRGFYPQRSRSRGRSSVRCFYCGKIGHLQKDCYSLLEATGSQPTYNGRPKYPRYQQRPYYQRQFRQYSDPPAPAANPRVPDYDYDVAGPSHRVSFDIGRSNNGDPDGLNP